MTIAPTRRALLITSDDEPVDHVDAHLVAAGYDVRRCVEHGAPGFPCVGLVGAACPLEADGGVDVAVDVRQHPWPHPTLRESGVTCALRAGVPLVVLGRPHHPFEGLATITTDRQDVLATRCEQAISVALEPVRDAVAGAVRAVFANHGVDFPFTVDVQRRLGRMHVAITTAAPGSVRGMAANRAAVAIRRLDRTATAIEIEIIDPA